MLAKNLIKLHIQFTKINKKCSFLLNVKYSKTQKVSAFLFLLLLKHVPFVLPPSPSCFRWHFRELFEESAPPLPIPPLLVAFFFFLNMKKVFMGHDRGRALETGSVFSFPSLVELMWQSLLMFNHPTV